MGVVLFLRLGWAIGEAGTLGVLSMFIVGELQTLLTVLSITAIVTNGKVKGGGAYFVISRCMGPAFGGSIGILFYLAYAISCAFYTLGVATEWQQVFYPDDTENARTRIIISTVVLAVTLVVSLGGAHAYTKLNFILFVLQMLGVFYGLVSFSTNDYKALPSGGFFTGWTSATFQSNLYPEYTRWDATMEVGAVECPSCFLGSPPPSSCPPPASSGMPT
jgi:potassium/chloride transporter 9